MRAFTSVISIRVPEEKLQFEGQTKSKLGTPDARSAVEQVLAEKLTYFFEENPTVSQMLIKKAVKASQAREAARRAREEARNGKKNRKKDVLSAASLHQPSRKTRTGTNSTLSRVTLPAVPLNRDGIVNFRQCCRCAVK